MREWTIAPFLFEIGKNVSTKNYREQESYFPKIVISVITTYRMSDTCVTQNFFFEMNETPYVFSQKYKVVCVYAKWFGI